MLQKLQMLVLIFVLKSDKCVTSILNSAKKRWFCLKPDSWIVQLSMLWYILTNEIDSTLHKAQINEKKNFTRALFHPVSFLKKATNVLYLLSVLVFMYNKKRHMEYFA